MAAQLAGFTGSLLGFVGVVFMCGPYFTAEDTADSGKSLRSVARTALSKDKDKAAAAIETLRAAGQYGVDAFIEAHKDALPPVDDPELATLYRRLVEAGAVPVQPEERDRVERTLDAICAQRDCAASRLFWHTDFANAKMDAQATGKPILSLRLLGRLDEEFSCANSRFFRTTLYSNQKVSAYLRDKYVLHWKSVCPAPRVMVDFGDGRKLERTITGNSIHYVLDSDGRPVEGLPGLFGPRVFLAELQRANNLARKTMLAKTANERRKMIKDHHEERMAEAADEWAKDLAAQGVKIENPTFAKLEQATDENMWAAMAMAHWADGGLDASSKVLIRRKHPAAAEAMPRAETKAVVETPMQRMFFRLQRDIATDTIQNKYRIHPEIHAVFVSGGYRDDVDKLNEWVYSQIFLTPDEDPWLGLANDGTFSALDRDGRIE